MANYSIKQGESKALELAIYDENNNAVDLSAAVDIKLLLQIKGVTAAKYALAVTLGYGILEVKASPDSHIIVVELTREQSKAFTTGYITAYVAVKWDDLILADGLVKEYNLPVGQVFNGQTKDEVLAV